jgi:Gram-negative bacterial TonB protein C-terminal
LKDIEDMKKNILFFLLFWLNVFNISAQDELPLKILAKPTPRFTFEQEKNPPHAQGTVTLRVEFLANGQIGEVITVAGLPNGLTENAVDAAQKIKFEVAKKNGSPVTVSKQVQYSYQYGWIPVSLTDEKAEAIIKRAVEKLGGEKYLQVKSVYSSGYYTLFREGVADMPNTFIDVIAYPDKERTEFKQAGIKTIQTNYGDKGWLFDGGTGNIREQREAEVENFKRGLRTSIDSFLRGLWRNQGATLSYIGRREASLGKRNEVLKLTYSDGFEVEYEFSVTDGFPMKTLFKGKDSDEAETKEEDRFAQFVDIQGVMVPFIADHFINGKQTSRINYLTIELNKQVPAAVFEKPADAKSLKKDLKL